MAELIPTEKPKRNRNWCFTINHYEEVTEPFEVTRPDGTTYIVKAHEDNQIVLRKLVPADAEYIVFGREVGEQGTPHLQGFVKTKNEVSMKKLKKIGFARAHLEIMEGTHADAIEYCKKDGDWEEYGAQPCQGFRTDLVAFKHQIELGKRPLEVAEQDQHFSAYARYHTGLDKYAHHIRGKRIKTDRTPPKVYIRIGGSGSGKTKWLDEHFGPDGWARMPNPTGNWWITPTVSDSDTVLIDDVGPTKVPKIEELLEWTDRYPIEFNAKGGFLWWKPKNIVITSNCHYREWWKNLRPEHLSAFERRVYRVDYVYKDNPNFSEYPNGNAVQEEEVVEPPPREEGEDSLS